MSAPDYSGWETRSIMASSSYTDQAFELARLQTARTNQLPADIVDLAFRYSLDHLAEGVLPEGIDETQVQLFFQNGIRGIKGGGLQFNYGDVGVRVTAYSVENLVGTPEFPFTEEEAAIILKASQGLLKRVLLYDRLSISPDLTTIKGAQFPLRIIQVPLQID